MTSYEPRRRSAPKPPPPRRHAANPPRPAAKHKKYQPKLATPPATAVPIKLGAMDGVLLGLIIGLVGFGLVMVFSASFYAVQETGGSPWAHMFKQGIIAVGGLAVMLFIARIDYRKLANPKLVALFLGFSVLLLLLVLFFGVKYNGSRRWFKINIPGIVNTTYQPSEQAKLALMLFMATNMAKRGHKMVSFRDGLLPNLVVTGVMCVLVMLQPNLSTTVSIVAITAMMMLLGGAKLSHLSLLGIVAAVAIIYLAQSETYRSDRIVSFLNPFEPELRKDESYQLVQSLLAIGAGGLFGVGPGMSRQKLLFLTYADSDFIFAIIAEELGLIGCIALLAAYVAVIARGVRVAIRCQDRFGSLLAAGTTGMLAIQVILHVAVVTGSMPTTGLPLPFISAGGASLLAFMAAMGMLLSVSRSLPQRKTAKVIEEKAES